MDANHTLLSREGNDSESDGAHRLMKMVGEKEGTGVQTLLPMPFSLNVWEVSRLGTSHSVKFKVEYF